MTHTPYDAVLKALTDAYLEHGEGSDWDTWQRSWQAGAKEGYLRAKAEDAPLLEALQAVYTDVELQNMPGGSEELNLLVQAAIAQALASGQALQLEEQGEAP